MTTPNAVENSIETLFLADAVTPDAQAWTQMGPETSQDVFPASYAMTLSPSAVAVYLRCPRQYFYQYLLNLGSQEMTLSALTGTLTHRVLEVFNRHYSEDHTLSRLEALLKELFEANHSDALSLNERGELIFTPWDLAMVNRLSPLQRQQMHRQLEQAFQDMAKDGYFTQPFQTLYPEETVMVEHVAGVKNFHLKGRIDLIRHRHAHQRELVDYKTSRRYKTTSKLETNLGELLNALTPVDWDDPEPSRRYAKRDYQLPLYWWMLNHPQQNSQLPTDVTVQVVRAPVSLNTRQGGSMALTVPHEKFVVAAEHLEDLLKNGVAQPLQHTQTFEPKGDRARDCGRCDFAVICEGPPDVERDWAAEEA